MIEIIEQAIANYTAEITKRAETAEKQLKLAEKSLFVKDKRIVELEEALNKSNAEIASLKETIKKLYEVIDQKGIENNNLNNIINTIQEQLAIQTSTITVNGEKDQKIKELEERLTVVENVNKKWKNIHIADRVRITEVEQIIKKYASALKDLEGTLCASYDHLKELSNSIYTIVK